MVEFWGQVGDFRKVDRGRINPCHKESRCGWGAAKRGLLHDNNECNMQVVLVALLTHGFS